MAWASGFSARLEPRHLALPAAAIVASVLAGYGVVQGGSFESAVFGLPVAVGIVLLAAHRPGAALVVLALAVPFYPYLFGKLLLAGAPAGLLAAARFWKELVLLGIVAAALRRGIGPVDRLDVLAGSFLALILLYMVLPGGGGVTARLLAGRQEAAFVVLFVACRRLDLGRTLPRLAAAVVLAGLVLSAFAFWNSLAPLTWSDAIRASGYIQYEAVDLGTTVTYTVWYGTLSGQSFVRAGSLLLSPLTLAYYLLIPLSVLLAALGGFGRRPWLRLVLVAGIGAGLLLTLTRSAIFLLPALGLLLFAAGRQRSRGTVTIALAAAVLWPLATSIGVFDRLLTALNPNDPSGSAHVQILGQDLATVARHPLGLGLGSAGSASVRAAGAAGLTTESWYFQVGADLGVLGMALAVALILVTLHRLWRRTRDGSGLATTALLALTGVALGGLVLQTFDDVVVAWPVWMLAGLAVPAGVRAAAPGREQLPATAASRPGFREAPA